MTHYHFIGIGGIGMSGLARLCLQRGDTVSGSDPIPSAITEELASLGAALQFTHQAENVPPNATVVYSSAVRADNPELLVAKQRAQPLMHRAKMLAHLCEGKKVLAVAGSHGKTTTTGLLIWILKCARMDPAYAVGGILANTGDNASWGKGEYFVVEADESDGSFLNYHPHGAILLNVESEHLDHWHTLEGVMEGFRRFRSQCSGPVVWCGDDPVLKSMAMPGIRYGKVHPCEWGLRNLHHSGWRMAFDVLHSGAVWEDVLLNLVGEHNALNSLAAIALAREIGVAETSIRTALGTFRGMGRRCEVKGSHQHITVIDDYGHHPTEIAATLRAIRHTHPERVIVIYQPHRFSRTRDTVGLYKHAFADADHVWITDIYAAGEDPIPGITHRLILDEVEATPIRYAPRSDLPRAILKTLLPGDVVLTLGAGDVTRIGPELLRALKQQRFAHVEE